MRDQFALLRALQRLDDRLRTLQGERQNLPQHLLPYETACETARQKLARLQEDIAHAERQRRTFEREVESAQASLVKTQHKLHEIKTNKEYSAVLSEIEAGKQRVTALEDQVLERMEVLEQHRRALQKQEQCVSEATRELATQRAGLQQALAALEQQIAVEDGQRQQIVVALDPSLYTAYQRLAEQRGGHVVVHVQDSICGGCFLKVQPQLVSEIRQQDKLLRCPHCRRMLLWPVE